jgi:hypothetical protein
MSNKHYNLKGLVDPNLKNPATGGGYQPHPAFLSAILTIIVSWLKSIRTYIPKEQIQEFAMKYATENPPKGTKRLFEDIHVNAALAAFKEIFQPSTPSPPPTPLPPQKRLKAPFVSAIITYIRDSAEEHGVFVNIKAVVAFANEYASMMPEKMQEFLQSDVEHALAVFQENFEPPAPSPQPPRQKNPNSLFEQIRTIGRNLGIPEPTLVKWLKKYVAQPHILPNAENPSHHDFVEGCKVMNDEISPGAEMFRNVCEHGLSPETVGPDTFRELMRMNHGPQRGQIYAFKSCPDPVEILHGLTFKRIGGFGQVTCFIKGVCFQPNGNVRHFNYPNFKAFKARKFIPPPIDGSILVWAAEVGQACYTKTTKDFGGLSLEIFQENSSSNSYGGSCGYTNDNSRDDLLWMDKHISLCVGAAMTEDRDEFFGRTYVTAPERENLLREHEHAIRTSPDYQVACNKAMAEIGGIPVSLCSTFGHEEDERAEDSDPCSEEAELSWGAAAEH